MSDEMSGERGAGSEGMTPLIAPLSSLILSLSSFFQQVPL